MSGRGHIVLVAALALASAVAARADNTIVCWKAIVSQPCIKTLVGDTEAGLPSSGVPEGFPAWAKDTDRLICYYGGSWQPCNASGGLSDGDKGDVTVASSGAAWTVDSGAVGAGELADDLGCSASQAVRRDGSDAGWECFTAGAGGAPTTVDYLVKTADAGLSAERVVTDTSTVTWDWATGGQAKATTVDVTCTNCLTGTEVDESSLGTVPTATSATSATTATTATTADAGDSATAFFPSGTFEDALVDGSLEADEVNPTLGSQTQGNYVAGATASQGLLLTGTEGASLGLIDCAATEVLQRNAGDTAWECATVGGGSGLTHPQVMARLAVGGGY